MLQKILKVHWSNFEFSLKKSGLKYLMYLLPKFCCHIAIVNDTVKRICFHKLFTAITQLSDLHCYELIILWIGKKKFSYILNARKYCLSDKITKINITWLPIFTGVHMHMMGYIKCWNWYHLNQRPWDIKNTINEAHTRRKFLLQKLCWVARR